MRPIATITMFALAASAIAAPAVAATDMYLELGPIKGESSGQRAAGGKVQLSSIHFSASRKGWYGTIKGRAAGEGAAPAGAKVSVQDMHVTTDASSPDPTSQRLAVSDPGAAGPKTTSKRQHGSVTISKPLDRGSVTVKGRFPDCLVGATYPTALLQTAAGRYELSDVVISGCAAGGVALNYKKVTVRGWDPAKKEE